MFVLGIVLYNVNLFGELYSDALTRFRSIALDLQLHKTKQWNRFLYIEDGQGSLVVNEDFFVSAKGASDPHQELLDSLDALFERTGGDKHFLCRFPARSKWLISRLQIPKSLLSDIRCEGYQKYLEMVEPKSVWLVFASYHLKAPASSFGHTFLRLGKQKQGINGNNDLLDYSVNFAANPDSNNALVYAWKGLFGGFKGNFSALPYYYKIREYNDYESRDLWNYKLALTEDEISKLLDLVWELDRAQFNYYYITKNCSYFLLALLDAISEDFNFLDRLPAYVIPIDTVRAVQSRPGFVNSIVYRPSVRSRLWEHYEKLDEKLKRSYLALDLSQAPAFPATHGHSDQAKLLDLALIQFDYLYPKEILNGKGPEYEAKKKYLLARSRIPLASVEEAIEPNVDEFPHEGHPGTKFTLGLGYRNSGGMISAPFMDFRFRGAFHEWDDSERGHFFSTLDMFDVAFRYYTDNKSLRLHRLTLFDVFNIQPLNPLDKKQSWRIELGLHDFNDAQCEHCYGLRLGMGTGLAVQANHHRLKPTLYALGVAKTDLYQSDETKRLHTRLGLGPQFGLWTRLLSSKDHLIGSYEVLFDPFEKTKPKRRFLGQLKYGYTFWERYQVQLAFEKSERFEHYLLNGSYYF